MTDPVTIAERTTTESVATTSPNVAVRAMDMVENVIDDPLANRVADLALALVPAFLAVSFAVAMIAFTATGRLSAELFVGIASSAIGYYLALKTGPTGPSGR